MYFFSTPPSLHAGYVRAMVGHLKFRVFPPFPLQPFIADRLRSITRLEKGNDSYAPQHCLKHCYAAAETYCDSRGIGLDGRLVYFCTFDPPILDVRIVPLSVQIMKSCNNTLRPLEDHLDGSEQWQPLLKELSESDIFCSWSFLLNTRVSKQLN